jgi:hypothetical protein
LLRAPLLHFAVLGAALFAVERGLEARRSPGQLEMVLPAARIEAAVREHTRRTGQAPTPPERRTLARRVIDQEILLREALDLGLDSGDPVIERRLIQNLRFLGGREGSDARRLKEARTLGMVEGDLIVRRRLVQRMEQRLREDALSGEPSEEELAAHRLAEAARFTHPARVRVSHVFVAVEASEEASQSRAARLRESLIAAGVGPNGAGGHGDAFLVGPALPEQSEAELAKLFGPELAALAMDLELGSWSPPLRSPHGLHLLWLHERVESELPPLDVIRNRVRHSLQEARAAQALVRGLAQLRKRYRVRGAGALEAGVDTSPEGA